MNKKIVVLTIVGNMIIGIGISLLNLSNLGLDAFNSMSYGMSQLLHVGLGLYLSIFNILLIIPVFFLKRKAIGIGTVINMFLLGYVAEFFMNIWNTLHFNEVVSGNFGLQVIVLLIGVLVTCFGLALYMECNSGVGPYDAIAPIMEERLGIPFKYGRMITDVICTAIGLVSGMIAHVTTVGITTVLFVVGTGPIVSFFRDKVFHSMIYKN